MKIELIVIGKLQDAWLRQGAADYRDRLQRYGQIAITELPDLPCPANKGQKAIIEREGREILDRLRPRSYIIALDAAGRTFGSEELARFLQGKMLQGTSDFTFIIGGSLGLSKQVLVRAHLALSFSRLTFPHQLMRVLLLEQIYRVSKILAGEPYHK